MDLQNFSSHIQNHQDIGRQQFYSTYATQAPTNMVISRQITTEANKNLESVYFNNENVENSMPSNQLVSFDQKFSPQATATYPYSGLTSNFMDSAVQSYPLPSSLGISHFPSYPQEGFVQHLNHYPQANLDSWSTYSYQEPTSDLIYGTNTTQQPSMDVANRSIAFHPEGIIQNPCNAHYISNKNHYPQKSFFQESIPCLPKTENLNVTANPLADGFHQKFEISTVKNELGTTYSGPKLINSFDENNRGVTVHNGSHQTIGLWSEESRYTEAGNDFSSHLHCKTTLDSVDSSYIQNDINCGFHPNVFVPTLSRCSPINEFNATNPKSDMKPDTADILIKELVQYLVEQNHTTGLPPQEFVQKCSPRPLTNELHETCPNDDVKPSTAELSKELALYLDSQNRTPDPFSEGFVQKFSSQSLKNEFETTYPQNDVLAGYKDDTHQQTTSLVPDNFEQKFNSPTAGKECIRQSYPYCAFSPISEDDYDGQSDNASHSVDQRETPGFVPTEFIPFLSSRLLHFETPDSVDALKGHHGSQKNVTNSMQGLLSGTFTQKFSPCSSKNEFETTCEDAAVNSYINSGTQHTSHLEIENRSSGFSHSFRMLTPEYAEDTDDQKASQSKSPNEQLRASRMYHALTPDSIDASSNHASDVPNQTNPFLLKEKISYSPIDKALNLTIARHNVSLHPPNSAMDFNTTNASHLVDIENITCEGSPTISKNENIIPKIKPPENICQNIRPTENIDKTAPLSMDVQEPSSPNGENKDVSTFPKYSEPTREEIEADINAQMNEHIANLATREERFVEEMLAENPVIFKKRSSAKSVPESSSSAEDQLKRKRAEACSKSRFNAKVRRAKLEFRHTFMGLELKKSASFLNSMKETVDKLEGNLRKLGYSEEALQKARDKAGFDQTSFANSLELSKKWIDHVDD